MSSLAKLCRAIDWFNERVGRIVAWLAVIMVLAQFTIVIARYVFAIGSIPVQESIWYMHGILFMVGAGYTLLYDGHVRVDIFYREATPRRKALIDLMGVLFLLLPVCVAILLLSWSYVLNSWRVLEGSTEVAGLPLIFGLKTVIWVFAVLLALQGIALAGKAVLYLTGHAPYYSAASAVEPGRGEL
ncbi:MAG TPA: TRAP transporter small permease subunit [Aestuariivirgaceae bacterium]|nr:TRAP transporter small permease subunit [Aestuariivirgaceae bacterium]